MESLKADIAIIGAGPGGYTAAFYAADRGKRVVLIDKDLCLGGVCLREGCIPSKALLHATALMHEVKNLSPARGIVFGEPTVHLEKLRSWKNSIVDRLAQGLGSLSQARGITVVNGRASFVDSHTLRVDNPSQPVSVTFDSAIIAVGSKPLLPRALDCKTPRVMSSSEALELEEVPENLLVVGGGYIGLELGSVYARLGSQVVLVEALDTILNGLDADLAGPVMRSAERIFKEIRLGTRLIGLSDRAGQIYATFDARGKNLEESYDRILISVGRVASCEDLGLEHTQVEKTAQGFIKVNAQQQTTDPAIYAIGDVAGGSLLAHKASHEAHVTVASVMGDDDHSKEAVIPSVVYTDPEVAWCGLTEIQAKAKGVAVQGVRFPWSASGRALTLDRPDGLTKLIIDPVSQRVLGVGCVGVGAGELIGQGVLAVRLGATARDLADSVLPHPTLSETFKECAELYYGFAAHFMSRRRLQR